MTEAQQPALPGTGGWRGSKSWVGAAALGGAALSYFSARISATWFDAEFPLATIDERVDQLFAIQAFIAAVLAITSTLCFALAHNRDDRKNTDYVGKLLAVSTLVFISLAAQRGLSKEVQDVLLSWSIAIGACLIFFTLPFSLPRGASSKLSSVVKN